jgi:NIMA (never in mitosis gene a)-related kinase 1/4/5
MAAERSSLADFKLMGKLGTGTFGVVWKVVRKADSSTYALKEVDLSGLSRKEQQACVHEVHVLARMDCPYIIKYCALVSSL